MEKAFIKPYEQGWASKPAENSWVTPQIMDNYDNAIDEIDNRVIEMDGTTNGLMEDLTQIYADGFASKNMLVGIENGSINDLGVDGSNTARARSIGYIEVEPNTDYTFSHINLGGKTVRTIIREFSAPNTQKISDNGWSDLLEKPFTTSANTHYIRLIFAISDGSEYPERYIGNAQLEKGSATPYTPYAPSNIELKNSLTQMQTSTNWLVKHYRSEKTTSGNGNVRFDGLTKANTIPLFAMAYDADGTGGHYPCIIYSYASGLHWGDNWGCKVVSELSSPNLSAITNKKVMIHVWYMEFDNTSIIY